MDCKSFKGQRLKHVILFYATHGNVGIQDFANIITNDLLQSWEALKGGATKVKKLEKWTPSIGCLKFNVMKPQEGTQGKPIKKKKRKRGNPGQTDEKNKNKK